MTAVRFYLDEHIPPAVASALGRLGIDALTTQAAGRLGSTDEDNLAWCMAEGFAIITHDDDYLRLASASPVHAGVVFCVAAKYGIGGLAEAARKLAQSHTAEDLRGRAWYL